MNQKQAVDWLNAQIGQYLDFDGNYGAQCFDLFNFYYQALTGRNPYSDGYGVEGAKDIWTVPTDLFDKIPDSNTLVPQGGDILIYGSNWGGGYGHVECVLSSDANGSNIVGNNETGNPSLPAQQVYRTWGQMHGLIGVLRFHYAQPPVEKPAPVPVVVPTPPPVEPVTVVNPDPVVDPPVVEPLPEPLPIPDEVKPVHIDVPVLPKNSEIKSSVAIIITILSVLAGIILAVINHK